MGLEMMSRLVVNDAFPLLSHGYTAGPKRIVLHESSRSLSDTAEDLR